MKYTDWYIRTIYYDYGVFLKTESLKFEFHRQAKEYYLKFLKEHQELPEGRIICIGLLSITYDRETDKMEHHYYMSKLLGAPKELYKILGVEDEHSK